MEHPEPIIRLEETLFHPADKTLDNLHSRGTLAKQELSQLRQELSASSPRKVQQLKKKISKKHDELMEILKNEEKINREIQDNKP